METPGLMTPGLQVKTLLSLSSARAQANVQLCLCSHSERPTGLILIVLEMISLEFFPEVKEVCHVQKLVANFTARQRGNEISLKD